MVLNIQSTINIRKTGSFDKEWGFATLGSPIYVLGEAGLYSREANGFDWSIFTNGQCRLL